MRVTGSALYLSSLKRPNNQQHNIMSKYFLKTYNPFKRRGSAGVTYRKKISLNRNHIYA